MDTAPAAGTNFPIATRGRVLFVCGRPGSDPAVAGVATELGYEILRVRSADEALRHAAPPGFALILAGYTDDVAAFADVVRRLRAAFPRTPLVAIGPLLRHEAATEPLYEAGALSVLQEPVSATILKAKARFYLDAYANAAELRRLADDLAEQDRRKTEFLATLAHELRNPLAPIRSGLQLMRRTKGDPAAQARVEDIMDRQLDHLVHLVDDLLDVARITRGQVELKPEWISLDEVVRAAVDTSLPLIEAARHRLDLRLPAEALDLYADPTRLTQVVSNLLNNAARYTPRGGAILVAAERDGEHAVIVVSDNGIGIAPESLESVFQMFTQVAPPTQRGNGGLGIGLSLVRSLVELHGGTVSAASAGIGAGSVFTVRLPLAGKDSPAPQRAALAPIAPAAGLRLLVVDDNRDAAETLSALLAIMGHTAPVAADGHQAVRMIASLRPHVVFLDIGMPGMSGYEVAQAVRADPQCDGVRLVALTGWGGAADRARTSAAGFDAHLTKPATVAAIEEVLARLAPP
ncbi:ATP-binding protein [Massilia sp. LXY-6]|uniref:ATP-binding response regulator n=1 Tax=Massilia sp. LXY-6 TaxID=3379823 RepID=UPI003EE310FB